MALAAEVLAPAAIPPEGPSLADLAPDVTMDVDSPRSDIAEAGGIISESDPGFISDSEPLRLSGGASCAMNFEEGEYEDDLLDQSDEEDSDLVELGFLRRIQSKLNIQTMTGKIGGRPVSD